VDVPLSTDCAAGGVCAGLGKLASQCAANGFCVTGGVPLPLAAATGTYSVDASGQMLFGWDDASTGATVNGDGTWALPAAVFANPAGPNGMRLNAGGLSIAMECTMGVDAGGPDGPVPPVAGEASPTPDANLIPFDIQVP
jgi:hypothetical protein